MDDGCDQIGRPECLPPIPYSNNPCREIIEVPFDLFEYQKSLIMNGSFFINRKCKAIVPEPKKKPIKTKTQTVLDKIKREKERLKNG